MNRFFVTGSVVCCLGLVVVAAPALSFSEYRPEPVNFSMAASADALQGVPGRRGDGVVSEPLRAPKRFNLVGLSWDGASREPALAVRTRTDGGDWTRWTPLAGEPVDGPDPGDEGGRGTGVSSPAWVGDAEWVQYRSSEALPGLRLRFVNVQGTATAGDRARTALRGAVNGAMVAMAGVARTAVASAGGPQPAIVPREDWGAASCPPRSKADYGEVRAALVHHTVSPNDYSRAEAPDVVLAICRYHRNSNGWNDIGYNFLVDRFGTIYEGRAGGIDQPVIGAQAQGFNSQSTGIANLGTFSSVKQTQPALNAMAALIRWKLPLEGAPTAGSTTLTSAGNDKYPAGRRVRLQRVSGHRDTGSTACPGAALYAQLPELRGAGGRPPARRHRHPAARAGDGPQGHRALRPAHAGDGSPDGGWRRAVHAASGGHPGAGRQALEAGHLGHSHRQRRLLRLLPREAHPPAARALRRVTSAAAGHLPSLQGEGSSRWSP